MIDFIALMVLASPVIFVTIASVLLVAALLVSWFAGSTGDEAYEIDEIELD